MWLPRVFSFMHSELQWSHLHGANVPTLVGFPLRNVAGRAVQHFHSAPAQLPTKSTMLVYWVTRLVFWGYLLGLSTRVYKQEYTQLGVAP